MVADRKAQVPEWEIFGAGRDWVFEHAGKGISIGVDGVGINWGELSANVHIESILPGSSGSLHWSYGALSSPKYRLEILNDVIGRTSGRIKADDWKDILLYVCNEVRQRYRSGSPSGPLSIVNLHQDPGFLVKPLVERGQTTICFARPGTGKSYLAQLLAIAAATGRKLPGLTPMFAPMPVLYLNGEGPKLDQDRRFTRLCNWLGLTETPPLIIHREMRNHFLDEIGSIRVQVEREGVGLVILDSISAVAGGDLKDDRTVKPFMQEFNSIPNAGRFAIAHLTKEDAKRTEGASSIYGNMFFEALARSTWEMVSADEGTSMEQPDGSRITVYQLGLYHRKANETRKWKPFGLRTTFYDDPEGVTTKVEYKTLDIEQHPALMGRDDSQTRQIRAALRNCPADGLTVEEIKTETGITKEADTIYRVLRGMPDAEMVAGGRGKTSRWRLKAEATWW